MSYLNITLDVSYSMSCIALDFGHFHFVWAVIMCNSHTILFDALSLNYVPFCHFDLDHHIVCRTREFF